MVGLGGRTPVDLLGDRDAQPPCRTLADGPLDPDHHEWVVIHPGWSSTALASASTVLSCFLLAFLGRRRIYLTGIASLCGVLLMTGIHLLIYAQRRRALGPGSISIMPRLAVHLLALSRSVLSAMPSSRRRPRCGCAPRWLYARATHAIPSQLSLPCWSRT